MTRSLILALLIWLSAMPTIGAAFPLIDLDSATYQRLANILILMLGSWIAWKPFQKKFLLTLSAFGVLGWITNYSLATAFYPHVILLGVYAYLCEGQDKERRQNLSISFFSGIFFASLFFKLNNHFIAGDEFLNPNGIFFYIKRFPELNFLDPGSSWYPTLAWTTILAELSAAIFVWYRPNLAIQFACIFFLILSFIHPPVLFVFFCFLPFYFQFSENKYSKTLEFFPFWLFIFFLAKTNKAHLDLPWDIFIISTAALIVFIADIKRQTASSPKRNSFTARDFTPAILVLITVFLKLAGLPGPVGYSMFSGQLGAHKLYELKTDDQRVCIILSSSVKPSLNQGIVFLKEKNGCSLGYPTESGLNYIKQFVCKKIPDAGWIYTDDSKNSFKENCRNEVNL